MHAHICNAAGIDLNGPRPQADAAEAVGASFSSYRRIVSGVRPVTAKVVAPWLAAVGVETVNRLDGSLDVLQPPPPGCWLKEPTPEKCDPVIEAWARLGQRINAGGAGWARTVRLLLEEHVGGRAAVDAYVERYKAARAAANHSPG